MQYYIYIVCDTQIISYIHTIHIIHTIQIIHTIYYIMARSLSKHKAPMAATALHGQLSRLRMEDGTHLHTTRSDRLLHFHLNESWDDKLTNSVGKTVF